MAETFDGWALKRIKADDGSVNYYPVYADEQTAIQWSQNVTREAGYDYSVVRVRRSRDDFGEQIIEDPEDWAPDLS